MKILITLSLLFVYQIGSSQNCLDFKSQGDLPKFEACKTAEGAEEFYHQFSRAYQQIYDAAIEICPSFATAYHAKSVAYLKSGNYVEWKKLMDKAVELEPEEYLGYRASCRFQFVHDYEGAIKDIDQLKSITSEDPGYTSDGDYHLDIVKAICYKELGDHQAALKLFETKFAEENYDPGLYDFYHLGVIYKEEKLFEKAIKALEKQTEINNLAEICYQLAVSYKGLNKMDNYQKNLAKAKKMYLNGKIMHGAYTTHFDKIYLSDIEQEIESNSFILKK